MEFLESNEQDIFDWDFLKKIPTDTSAAISLIMNKLKASFYNLKIPLILKDQIYTVLANRTQVDQELALLRAKNTQEPGIEGIQIRFIRLPGCNDQVGIVLAKDYDNELGAQMEAAKTASESLQANSFRALRRVMRTHSCLYVTRGQFTEQFAGGLKRQGNSKILEQYLESLDKYQAEKIKKKEKRISQGTLDNFIKTQSQQLTTAALRFLVRAGYLSPRHDDRTNEAYWISMPEVGKFLRDLHKGRSTIVKMIQQTKYKEIQMKELEKRTPKKYSGLPFWFVVQYLLGSEFLRCIKIASGDLIKLNN